MGALFSRSKQSKEKLDEIRNKYGNAIREGNASLIKGANDYIEQVHPNLPPHIKARILEGFNVSNAPILNRIANWFGIEGEIHKRRLRYILQHQEYKNYIKKSPTLAAQKQALDAIPPLALNVIVDHAVNTAVNDPHLHSKYKPNTSFFGSLFNTPVFDPVSRVIDDAIHTNQQQHLSKINRQLQELGESPSTESSAEFRERIEKQKEEERLRRQKEANAIARIYIPKNAPLKQVVQVEQVAQVPKEPGAFNMTRRNARIQKNNAEIYNKMWEEFNIEYNKVGIMQIYVDVLKNNMKALGLYRNTRQEWIERYEKDLQSIKEMIEELQTYEKVNVPTSISNAPLNLKEKYNMKLTEIRDLVKTAGRVLLRIYWDVTGLKKNGKLAEWEKLMKVYGLLQIDIECTILKKGNDCSPNDQRQMYDANRDIIIDIHTGSVINAESVPSSPVPSSPVPVYNPKRYNLPNNAKRVMELATAPAFYPAPPLPNRQSNQRRESLSNFFDPSIVAEMNETLISKPKSRRIERVGEIYNSTYRPPNVTPVVTYHSTNDLPINRTQEHQGFNRAIYTSNFDMQMEEKRAAEKKAAENNAAKKAAANKLAANKAAANKATANKAVANKAAANKAVANKEAANKAAINNVKTKQKQVFTELENRQAAKEKANQIAKEQANMPFNIGENLKKTMELQEKKNKNVTNRVREIYMEENPNEIVIMNGVKWNQPESLGRFNVNINTCDDLIQRIEQTYKFAPNHYKIRRENDSAYIELSRLCEKKRINLLSEIFKQPVTNIYISLYPKIKVQFMKNTDVSIMQEVFMTKKISELTTITGETIIINGQERPVTSDTRLSDVLTIEEQKMYENTPLQVVLPSSGGKRQNRRYTRHAYRRIRCRTHRHKK